LATCEKDSGEDFGQKEQGGDRFDADRRLGGKDLGQAEERHRLAKAGATTIGRMSE